MKNLREGSKKQMKCGLVATIINIRNENDIDILFENGIYRKHISFHDFERGSLKAEYVSLKNPFCFKNGQMASILDYNKKTRKYRTLFEDGEILELNRNQLKNQNARKGIGEIRMMNNGFRGVLIDREDYTHCTVLLEDGTVAKNVRYNNFQNGKVSKDSNLIECNNVYPKKESQFMNIERAMKRKELFMGKTQKMGCGLHATIIDYHSPTDITIQFENGSVKTHVRYGNFVRKQVKVKKNQTKQMIISLDQKNNIFFKQDHILMFA